MSGRCKNRCRLGCVRENVQIDKEHVILIVANIKFQKRVCFASKLGFSRQIDCLSLLIFKLTKKVNCIFA